MYRRSLTCLFILSAACAGPTNAAVDFQKPKGAPSYDLPVFNQLLLRTLYSQYKTGQNYRLSELLDGPGFPEKIQDSDLVWSTIFESAYSIADTRWFKPIKGWSAPVFHSVSNGGKLLDVSGIAERGDVIRLKWPSGAIVVLVYRGRYRFPDGKVACRYYYPFWPEGCRRLQRNSFPPRFNHEITRAFVKKVETKPMKPLFDADEDFKDGWLKTPLAGAYARYYVPFKQWKKSPGSVQVQVVRYRGWMGNMPAAHRDTLEKDLLLAVKMSDHCVQRLNETSPDSRTTELLKKCFNSSPKSRRKVARLYREFPQYAIRMMIGYGPNNPLEDSEDPPNAKADRFTTATMMVWQSHFKKDQYRRAQTLIHEFTHLTGKWGHPGTGNYAGNYKKPYVEHSVMATDRTKLSWTDRDNDGKKERIRVADPEGPDDYNRRIRYAEATRNPYCYGLFAYWLCK